MKIYFPNGSVSESASNGAAVAAPVSLKAGSGLARRSTRFVAVFLALVGCLSSPLKAVEILNDLADNSSPTISYVPGYGIGFPFVSGADSTTVDSLTIGYGSWLTGGIYAGPETVVLKIYAADGADARPGTVLGEFVFSSKDGSYATFVPATASLPGAKLAANGSFWIAIFNKGAAGSFFPYASVIAGSSLIYSGLTGYAFTGGELTSGTDESWPAPSVPSNNRRISVSMNGTINPPLPPWPTLKIKSPANVTASTSKVRVWGTSTDATLVEVKVGTKPVVAAGGTPDAWTKTLWVVPGVTVVQVRAVGPRGTSAWKKVTITRP